MATKSAATKSAGTKSAATELGRDAAEKVRASMGSTEFAQKAKDAAYTIVGLGVMGAQRATAATKQAASRFGVDDKAVRLDFDFDALVSKTKDVAAIARRQLSVADDVVEGALSRIEEALAPLEERLPDSAKETVDKMRGKGRELHAQVRTLVAGEADDEATDQTTKS